MLRELAYGAALLAIACTSTATPVPSSPVGGNAGDAGAGQQAYVAQGCGRCHGDRGEGGRGVRLAPVTKGEAAWLAAFRTEHSRDYPVSRLPDDQLRGVYAWLQTLR